MTGRYLALVGDRAARARLAEQANAGRSFAVTIESRRTTLLATADLPLIKLEGHGAILGTLFTAGRPGSLSQLSREMAEAIVASRGQLLINRYWGGYVAILDYPSQEAVDIVRAPFGWLPCFHADGDGAIGFASDLMALRDCGLYTPKLDRQGLARHLLASDIRRSDTALSGIKELRGGDRLTMRPHLEHTRLWSPWTFADSAQQIEDADEAYRRLREWTLYSLRERSGAAEQMLVLMSGGLDSSIVAAGLHTAGRDAVGLTFVTDNPSGDEREPTRRVTDHLGMTLLDDRCRVDDVDVTKSLAAHLPRPIARSFAQGTRLLTERAAAHIGTRTIVDGGAGDNIFCSIQSPAPAADCLIQPSGRRHFWSTTKAIAELGEASVWTVAYRGWQRSRSGRPYRRAPDTSFLTPAALDEAEAALAHPWLHAPPGIPPGKTVHVGLLAPAQGLIEDFDPLDPLAPANILVSQPLIETCLRIPSWLWFDRGCNRAAARHAFAPDLPPETVWRRSKGTPDSFLVEILEANRETIRNMLSDGALAGLGLIDVASIRGELDDPRPPRGHSFARLMQIMDAEAWARGWPS